MQASRHPVVSTQRGVSERYRSVPGEVGLSITLHGNACSVSRAIGSRRTTSSGQDPVGVHQSLPLHSRLFAGFLCLTSSLDEHMVVG